MDCFDQQIFIASRRAAMMELVPRGVSDVKTSPGVQPSKEDIDKSHLAGVNSASGYATSYFMLGWAIGGIGFGVMSDRRGRVKTLMLTIFLYSIFTGLSAFSTDLWHFYVFRFLTGLGVGGVFAAAVTLLSETVPDAARPIALGIFQASTMFGNCAAAFLWMWLGKLQRDHSFDHWALLGITLTPWRIVYLVGILPGLIIVVIQVWVRESPMWLANASVSRGGWFSLFEERRWATRAVFGMMLAMAGVVGMWGIGFFSNDLQQAVAEPAYRQAAIDLGIEGVDETKRFIDQEKAFWSSTTLLMQYAGAFCGIFAFTLITTRLGRRWTFFLFFTMAGITTSIVFLFLNSASDILWMVPLMGCFQFALFGGYAIYLPELFPTRLRGAGTSFCYNVGRLFAAGGPAILALLTTKVFAGYPSPEPLRFAGVAMCAVFGLGVLALPFLPETKDQPLPE